MICGACSAPRAVIYHCGDLRWDGRIRVKDADTDCECHCREWRLWGRRRDRR